MRAADLESKVMAIEDSLYNQHRYTTAKCIYTIYRVCRTGCFA